MKPEKKLSEDMPQNPAWLASFPEKNPNPILEISLEGRIEYTNPAIRKLFPALLEQQTDHPYLANWGEISDQFQKQPEFVLDREVQVGKEYFQQSIFFVEEHQRLRVYGMNISNRKRLEIENQESEKKYRELVQYAPTGIYEVDFRTQRFLSVNDAMCILTGYSHAELMAMSPMEILDEPSRQLFRKRIQRWLAGEEPEKNVEYRVLAKDGHEIFAELNVTFTTDEQGKPVGATVIGHDITERKKMEEALRKSEEQYRTLIETSPDAIFVHADYHFLFANEAALNLFGADTFKQLQLYSVMDLLTIDERSGIRERIRQTLQGVKTPMVETRIIRIDGKETPIESMASLVEFQGRKAIQVIVRDISERKRAEEALQAAKQTAEQSQLILDAVIEQMPAGIIITNASGSQAKYNREMDRIWRRTILSSENIEGHRYRAFHSDGREYQLDEWPLSRALKQGEVIVGEEMAILRGDGTQGVLHSSSAPIRNTAGETIAGVVIDVDITDRKVMEQALAEANQFLEQKVNERTAELVHAAQELEKALQAEKFMRQQLIQSEKYAALARLVASVAHEINNPLQTIQNSLFLLQSAIQAEECQEFLEMAISESKRMSVLVQQLRETYRPAKDLQPVDVNLVDLINNAQALMQPQFRQNNIEFQMNYEEPQIRVHGVPDQLKQVFLNICLNAVDAMGNKGGQIRMDITQQDHKRICVAIRDTGPGISSEHLTKIFEPFFTTKDKGTGLGLAIVYEIVKDHGGEIFAESEPGKGASFKVWLPVAES